jgi:uncharacterized RDD family membrane protein YckC
MKSITSTEFASISSRLIALIISSRLIALILDGVVLGIVTGAIYSLLGATRIEGILTFLFTILYQWYFLTKYNGQTPGKMILGIRVIKTDGSPLSDTDAIIRALGYSLNWVLLGFGWLLAYWSNNRQGLHDILAKTYVIKAPSQAMMRQNQE